MQTFKTGIITDNLKLEPFAALKAAQSLQINGVQVYASGAMAPENLDKDSRKKYRDTVKAYGLEISALCTGIGSAFKQIPPIRQVVDATLKTIDLAVDLDTKIITSHIGHIPDDEHSARFNAMLEVCGEIGEYAKLRGVTIACETGTDTPETLIRFINKLPKDSFKINFDPANFVMCLNYDPVKAVYELGDYIVHTHVKDGVYVDGVKYLEKLPGQGDVDFEKYYKALLKVGYSGYLTVERECGNDRLSDIKKAVSFVKALIK